MDDAELILPIEEWNWGPPTDEERPAWWPDDKDVRRAMEWFRSMIPSEDWRERRIRIAKRLYGIGGMIDIPKDGQAHTLYPIEDKGGWYLFLAEAFVDHMSEYEPAQGSRVIPIFKSLGHNYHHLVEIEGAEDKARRFLTNERKQPDGVLFELLVAAAYKRNGWNVRFIHEMPGGPRTPDIAIERRGEAWVVECKRLLRSQYGLHERERFRELWSPASKIFIEARRSTLLDVHFRIELNKVPDNYLARHAQEHLESAGDVSSFDCEIAYGGLTQIDLTPMRSVLRNDLVMQGSQRMFQLLTGDYVRHASYSSSINIKRASNPLYIDEIDFAAIGRWKSESAVAIRAKARHFKRQLADACGQLQNHGPAIFHLGLEALEGDDVEVLRYKRVMKMLENFKFGNADVRWVLAHMFVPESPPDLSWAFDETCLWVNINSRGNSIPLMDRRLVATENVDFREGVHWDGAG